MSKNIRELVTPFEAGAAVEKYRIVKFGADDDKAVKGAAATDFLIGVSGDLDAALGDRMDVVRGGITPVVYGGAVTRGDPLTSDANGKAVAAAPAAGVNNRIIGFAEVSGVLDDIGSVHVAPGRIQG